MDFSVLVIVLASIGATLWIIKTGIQHEEAKLKLQANATDQDVVGIDAHAEIARLKERVSVLERLMIDDDRKLADEINRLRGGEANPRA